MSEGGSPPHRKLDHAFVGGLAWTAGAKWLTQALTWASVLITARLLSPADFGLVGMAGIFAGITNMLAEFGIGTAVLQMPELDRRSIQQLNTLSVALCTIAFLISAAAAPLIAAFFRSDKLTFVVVINSLGLFITGFQAIPLGLLQRDLDYRRLSVNEAVLVAVQAAVTVAAAYFGAGFWSLIAGPVAGKAVAAALVVCWKPTAFAVPRWRQISAPLRLAWHVTVGRFAWSIYSQVDGIIVGRVMGDVALGLYQQAMNLATAPAEKIALLIMRVVGPLFAKVQNDQALVRRYFLIVTETLALSVFPLTIGLAAVAPEFVAVVLGPKWAGVVAPLRSLALFMGIRTMNSLMQQVLTSLRFTSFTMWMSLLNFLVMPIAFWVAAPWGIAAVGAAWLILSPVTIGPSVVKLLRAIGLRYGEYLDALVPALAGSAAMLLAVLGIRTLLVPGGWPNVIRLALPVAAGGLVYGGLMLALFRERMLRYVRFIRQLRRERATPVAAES